VAWISERKDVLSVLLGMVTLSAYLKYVQRPGTGRYLAVIAAFSLGLMAKPMLVTLPFVLLLLDFWPLGRFHRARPRTTAAPGTIPWRLILEKTPFMALAAASSVVTYLAQQRGGAFIPAGLFPAAVRIENALVSCARYVGKALWPHDLIPFYRHPGHSLSFRELALSFLLVAGLTALAVASRRRRPWLLTGWLWFLGVLVPVSGLVQVGSQGMADRYSYLPSIGLCMAITWEASSRAARFRRGAAALALISVAVIPALVFLTWRQTAHWKSTVTLFTRVVAIDTANYIGYNMLGVDYLLRHEAAKAVPLFRRALAIWPAYLDGRFNLGLALTELGETDEAMEQFAAILRIKPRDPESLFNLGKALLEKGRTDEALQHFAAAVALDPNQPAILFARGGALARSGRLIEAAEDFRRVVELDPGNAEARASLEYALRILGK